MTRINLVPVTELADQHLFAEWREIKMVPRSLQRSLRARGREGVLGMVPREFTLNTGHVSFFYDKGFYLAKRYEALSLELEERDYRYDRSARLDPEEVFVGLPNRFHSDYTPTPEALAIVRERIALRISQKPWFYTMRRQRIYG